MTTKTCNIVCYDKDEKIETIEFLRAYNIPFEVSGYGKGYYFAITCSDKEYEIIQAFCNNGTVYRVTGYYDSMFRGVAENHDTIYKHAAIETAIEYANKGYYVEIQSPENMTGDRYTPDEILERWL